MKEAFISKKFRAEGMELITKANRIIAEYRNLGYMLTLRQLYYQFVARGFIENTERSYKNLGRVINEGRMAGLIDWSAIEDRTRNLRGRSHWDHPSEIIKSAINSYHIDLWKNQPTRVEVWVEKDALVNAIERPCHEFDVPYMACRGYASQSEEYNAAKRIEYRYDCPDNGCPKQDTKIIYLGDHDPSGIDMTRDHQERLVQLSNGSPVEVIRIALNMDQIEQYDPPPNPAKETDSRCAGYQELYGDTSWELDALSPTIIGELVKDEIEKHIDWDLWEERQQELAADKEKLTELLGNL